MSDHSKNQASNCAVHSSRTVKLVDASGVMPVGETRTVARGAVHNSLAAETGSTLRAKREPLLGRRALNFGRPLRARKWLRLLCEDPTSGIRIQRNLDLESSVLGFSFDSNHLGLRGPCSPNGQAVVLGTSFAMGFAVDKGRDWFCDAINPSMWFNVGLPVGPEQWAGLLNSHYHGARELALLLYHPNVWQQAVAYTKWRSSQKGIFQFFGWKLGFWDCLQLEWRKVYERKRLQRQGRRVIIKESGRKWCFDANYSVMSSKREAQILNEAAGRFAALLDTFAHVICLRLPIKEQLIPDRNRNEHFVLAQQSYDEMWHFTQEKLARNNRTLFLEAEGFQLNHFHGFDTHLNDEGNRHLSSLVHRLLVRNGMNQLS